MTYLHLISNTADFTTVLSQPIHVDIDTYEVALTEIHVSASFFNLNTEDAVFFVEKQQIKITPGYYESVKELVAEINGKAEGALKLDIPESGFLKCETNKEVAVFSTHLSAMLGFRDQVILQGTTIAHYMPDMMPGMNAILIYTDIVQDTPMGDQVAPILKMLPILESQRNQLMSYACFPLQYKNLFESEISSIRIILRDDTGKLLEFSDKACIALTLHIRKK